MHLSACVPSSVRDSRVARWLVRRPRITALTFACLARALVPVGGRVAKVLLCDEATSNVDMATDLRRDSQGGMPAGLPETDPAAVLEQTESAVAAIEACRELLLTVLHVPQA